MFDKLCIPSLSYSLLLLNQTNILTKNHNLLTI